MALSHSAQTITNALASASVAASSSSSSSQDEVKNEGMIGAKALGPGAKRSLAENKYYFPPLRRAVEIITRGTLEQYKELLAEHPVLLSEPLNDQGHIAITLAIIYHKQDFVTFILSHCPNLLYIDSNGRSIIGYASVYEHNCINDSVRKYVRTCIDSLPSLSRLEQEIVDYQKTILLVDSDINQCKEKLLSIAICQINAGGYNEAENFLDLYFTINSVFKILVAAKSLPELMPQVIEFFKIRANYLRGDKLDYCYSLSLANEFCGRIAEILFPGEAPLAVLLNDAMTSHRNNVPWQDLLSHEDALPKTPGEFFRTQNNEIHVYESVIGFAFNALKKLLTKRTDIWLCTDNKALERISKEAAAHGVLPALSDDELKIMAQRVPTLITVLNYTKRIEEHAKAGCYDYFIELRNKLHDGDYRRSGSHYQTLQVTEDGVVNFGLWFMALPKVIQERIRKMGVDAEGELGAIIDILTDTGKTEIKNGVIENPVIRNRAIDNASRNITNTDYCTALLGGKLEKILSNEDVIKEFHAIDLELSKNAEQMLIRVEHKQLDLWQQQCLREVQTTSPCFIMRSKFNDLLQVLKNISHYMQADFLCYENIFIMEKINSLLPLLKNANSTNDFNRRHILEEIYLYGDHSLADWLYLNVNKILEGNNEEIEFFKRIANLTLYVKNSQHCRAPLLLPSTADQAINERLGWIYTSMCDKFDDLYQLLQKLSFDDRIVFLKANANTDLLEKLITPENWSQFYSVLLSGIVPEENVKKILTVLPCQFWMFCTERNICVGMQIYYEMLQRLSASDFIIFSNVSADNKKNGFQLAWMEKHLSSELIGQFLDLAMQKLIEYDAYINTYKMTSNHSILLHVAAYFNRIDIVNKLLLLDESGQRGVISTSVLDGNKEVAIQVAITRNHWELATILASRPCNATTCTNYSQALTSVISQNKTELALVIIDKSMSLIMQHDLAGANLVFQAALVTNNLACLKKIWRARFFRQGVSPLVIAAQQNNISLDTMRWLLELNEDDRQYDFDVNVGNYAENVFTDCPIIACVRAGRADKLALLLATKRVTISEINGKERRYEDTSVYKLGHAHKLALMLEYVNHRSVIDSKEKTAFDIAVEEKKMDCAKLLVESEDFDSIIDLAQTPLEAGKKLYKMYTDDGNDSRAVTYLKKLRSLQGRAAFFNLCKSCCNISVDGDAYSHWMEAVVIVAYPDYTGYATKDFENDAFTYLHYAVIHNANTLIKALVGKNYSGKDILATAIKNPNVQITTITLLIEHCVAKYSDFVKEQDVALAASLKRDDLLPMLQKELLCGVMVTWLKEAELNLRDNMRLPAPISLPHYAPNILGAALHKVREHASPSAYNCMLIDVSYRITRLPDTEIMPFIKEILEINASLFWQPLSLLGYQTWLYVYMETDRVAVVSKILDAITAAAESLYLSAEMLRAAQYVQAFLLAVARNNLELIEKFQQVGKNNEKQMHTLLFKDLSDIKLVGDNILNVAVKSNNIPLISNILGIFVPLERRAAAAAVLSENKIRVVGKGSDSYQKFCLQDNEHPLVTALNNTSVTLNTFTWLVTECLPREAINYRVQDQKPLLEVAAESKDVEKLRILLKQPEIKLPDHWNTTAYLPAIQNEIQLYKLHLYINKKNERRNSVSPSEYRLLAETRAQQKRHSCLEKIGQAYSLMQCVSRGASAAFFNDAKAKAKGKTLKQACEVFANIASISVPHHSLAENEEKSTVPRI